MNFWVDGIHANIRLEGEANSKQCFLVVMGATADGEKHLYVPAVGTLNRHGSQQSDVVSAD